MPKPARSKKGKNPLFSRFSSFFLSGKVFLPLFLISSFLLVQSFLKVRARQNQLEVLEGRVGSLRVKFEESSQELEYRRSDEFVYKEALEQLGYTKPGEVIVVLPDYKKGEEETSQEGNEEAQEGETQSEFSPTPNWKMWRTLFFES